MKERDLQVAIKNAINMTDLFRAFIVDVKPVWNSQKKCWMKTQADSGMPDIYIQNKGSWGFWIEVKTEKGKLSKKQKAKIEELWLAGARVAICHSVKDALLACESCRPTGRSFYPDTKLELMLKQYEPMIQAKEPVEK